MAEKPPPQSGIVLYQTEDGRTRIQCRLDDETLWLTQKVMAELFQKDVRTTNEHLVNIFDEGELDREATIRKFRIVPPEGAREVAREVEHYNLPAILAVAWRVRSHTTRPDDLDGSRQVTRTRRSCPETPDNWPSIAQGLNWALGRVFKGGGQFVPPLGPLVATAGAL